MWAQSLKRVQTKATADILSSVRSSIFNALQTSLLPKDLAVKRKRTERRCHWRGNAGVRKPSCHTSFSARQSQARPPVPAHRVMPCAVGYNLHASQDPLSPPVKCEQHRGPLQRLHCAVWVGPGTSWAKSSGPHKVIWVFTAVTDTPCPRAHPLLFPAGSEPLFEAPPAFGRTEPTCLDTTCWLETVQNREGLTSLVLVPAFFCSFSCYRTRNHLSKQHDNVHSCYFHLQITLKSGFRKNKGCEMIFRVQNKTWIDPCAGS